MAVGDVLQLEWAEVSEVQEGVRNALADGKRVLELEIPTTDRFKDTPLNRINEANTLYVREFVRMFTQPQELCVVFTDAAECKYAIEDWGGGPVPFKLSRCINPPPHTHPCGVPAHHAQTRTVRASRAVPCRKARRP